MDRGQIDNDRDDPSPVLHQNAETTEMPPRR
jgi:hypothetical protein